jgi:hypothetical protein
LSRWSIEDAITGNETGRIVHECDEPSVLAVQGNHLPITLPERHGVFSLIANPFPLVSLLHADHHSPMGEKDPVDRIVWNMGAIFFLDFLFKMVGAERIPVMRSKHEGFSLIRDWGGPFTLGSQAGRIAVLPIKGNDLVNPLPAYLMILRKIMN